MARTTIHYKDCLTCTEEFGRLDPRQKYCSRKCQPVRKNYKHSEATKKKIKESNLKTYAKLYPNRRARTARQLEIRGRKYRTWRKEVFTRDSYKCQFCSVSGAKAYLEVDHIKQWSTHPELRYEVDNGRTLCRDCHKEVTRIQRLAVWA